MEKTVLQLEMDTTYKKYEELREAVREEERSVTIPALNAKYKGKYFKGVIMNTSVYAFVISIPHTQKFNGMVFTLPDSKYGEHTFYINDFISNHILGDEITKEEWNKAFNTMVDRLHELR